ncbi:hypothetical protein Ciccas_007959 [Cichlidogyrus casuarinus]|uniref:C2 domain-containing protein n=1 Tax=Cichlidogyrus casuarinus TaxID=1844966 RepID=A0ABD2Q1D0_9PLAT
MESGNKMLSKKKREIYLGKCCVNLYNLVTNVPKMMSLALHNEDDIECEPRGIVEFEIRLQETVTKENLKNDDGSNSSPNPVLQQSLHPLVVHQNSIKERLNNSFLTNASDPNPPHSEHFEECLYSVMKVTKLVALRPKIPWSIDYMTTASAYNHICMDPVSIKYKTGILKFSETVSHKSQDSGNYDSEAEGQFTYNSAVLHLVIIGLNKIFYRDGLDGKGKRVPSCSVMVEHGKTQKQTKTIHRSSSPRFLQHFEFKINRHSADEIRFTVFHVPKANDLNIDKQIKLSIGKLNLNTLPIELTEWLSIPLKGTIATLDLLVTITGLSESQLSVASKQKSPTVVTDAQMESAYSVKNLESPFISMDNKENNVYDKIRRHYVRMMTLKISKV